MSEFVPFKIAKNLKEKGFKEECVAHYYSNDPPCRIKNTALADYVQQPFCIESIKRSWNRCELNPCSSGCYYDAPTISQVLKWLREEKRLYLGINYRPQIMKYCDFYFPTIQYIGELKPVVYTKFTDIFHTYEEAAFVGIEYVLDNLI